MRVRYLFSVCRSIDRPGVLQDMRMPNSPEAPGPIHSTVCAWGRIDPDALRLARQLDPSPLIAPCDDPAALVAYTLDAPTGRPLCASHVRDAVDAALAVACTPAIAWQAPRLTLAPLPLPYDEPIPFALVEADELAQLHQAQA